MMIPTCGASMSISSNTRSTDGIGSATRTSTSPLLSPSLSGASSRISSGSRISIVALSFSGGDAVNRPRGDVGAHLLAVELDPARRIVRALARLGRVGSQRGHVQHASPGGEEVGSLAGGPRVGDLDFR